MVSLGMLKDVDEIYHGDFYVDPLNLYKNRLEFFVIGSWLEKNTQKYMLKFY